MQEQRLTLRLMRYWELIRKDSPMPDINHFNTGAIEEIWPYCFKVSVNKHSQNSYTYEYIGESIAKLYGQDLTGLSIDSHAANFPGGVIHKKLPDVVVAGTLINDEGHFVSEHDGLIKYRSCFLPFGNEKKGVTHIVVGLSCRKF